MCAPAPNKAGPAHIRLGDLLGGILDQYMIYWAYQAHSWKHNQVIYLWNCLLKDIFASDTRSNINFQTRKH